MSKFVAQHLVHYLFTCFSCSSRIIQVPRIEILYENNIEFYPELDTFYVFKVGNWILSNGGAQMEKFCPKICNLPLFDIFVNKHQIKVVSKVDRKQQLLVQDTANLWVILQLKVTLKLINQEKSFTKCFTILLLYIFNVKALTYNEISYFFKNLKKFFRRQS